MSENTDDQSFIVVVVGASGDLAKKKTYPALFALFSNSLLPENTCIYGYARSELSDEKFRENIAPRYDIWRHALLSSFMHFQYVRILFIDSFVCSLKGTGDKQAFLSRCFYVHGQYDSQESFSKLDKVLVAKEQSTKFKVNNRVSNILFHYLFPLVFVD